VKLEAGRMISSRMLTYRRIITGASMPPNCRPRPTSLIKQLTLILEELALSGQAFLLSVPTEIPGCSEAKGILSP